jgi:hypothetical protein
VLGFGAGAIDSTFWSCESNVTEARFHALGASRVRRILNRSDRVEPTHWKSRMEGESP